ncbi:SusC/RagA family TonB-linked outer membrane protein [Dyadobacter aurulentus]|uniref:SusC/RagA family TonB-linked outer membrane protein n=1 Tax=Dyadobacter sp. UC 10 TaxID=2605428 RepID=UPI0011F397D6|nr:TonB-dependent receptor [Dyadobacter sp. UC 10]KAA0992249.1 TonB-dependent receptor [Dyadobacter sp. UC 10]
MSKKLRDMMFWAFAMLVLCPPEMGLAQAVASNRELPKATQQQSQAAGTISLREALGALSKKHGIIFEFNDNLIRNKSVDPELLKTSEKVEKTLSRILEPLSIRFERYGQNSYLIFAPSKPKAGNADEASLLQTITPGTIGEITAFVGTKTRDAEEIEVKGTVSGVDGEGLPGVSVIVEGTTRGALTDSKGIFKISVPDGDAKLLFSFVGYLSQRIAVGNQTIIDVILKEDTKALEEVVVVGYGTINKSDLTGSVAKINAEGVDERPIASVEQFLQGQVSGVQITQNTGAPGGGISFNIRGATSVSGSNQPLVVIDGYPVDSDNGGVKMSGGSQSGYLGQLPQDNALANLNPSDIESIEILKDASATAIYGSRASNGVVLVTTKRGKAGADRISYSFRYDVSELPKKIGVLNTAEYLQYSNEGYLNNGRDSIYTAAQIADLSQVNTNWQDLIYRQARTQNHQLSISGGQDKMRYAISLGYLSQGGIVKNSNYERGSIRINLDRQFNSKFKFGVNMSGTLSRNRAAMQSSNISDASMSVVRGALTSRPFDSPFSAEDELEIDQTQVGNPLTLVNLADDQNRMTTVLANIFGEYSVAKGLTFRVNSGVNVSSAHRDFYHPRGTSLGNLEGGYAYRGHINSFNYLTEYTLNYTKVLGGKHSINAVGGYTWQQWNRRSFGINALNFPNDNLLYYDMGSATSITNPSTNTTEWALGSFLGRLNYSFDKRYLITFTGRSDGSTRLAEGNKWAFFPSLALGWNVHNENFLKSVNAISELKVRASYGLSGNQAVGVGSTKAMLQSTGSVANQSIQIGYVLANLPNSSLHWETTRQTNVGADIALFGNRLSFGFDYYKKRTHDLLISLTIPPSNGFSSYSTNQGVIQNQGVEFDVKARALAGAFSWDISGNISRNRNKVISLGDGLTSFVGPTFGAVSSQSLTIAKVGSPIGAFYGYRIGGIYQNTAQIDAGPTDSYTRNPGSFMFRDISGPEGKPDGVITTDDREIIGSPYPDFIFGLTNTFEWRGLSLNVFFQGSIGQDVINANRHVMDALNRGTASNVRQEAWDNRWRGEGTSNVYPKPDMVDPFQSRFTDFIVEDASFVRLKNITLAYTLPKTKLRVFKTVKLFVSGGNLLTWTDYKGYDPEINSKGDNSMLSGIDNGSIPQYKTYSFGINAGF